MKNKTKNIILKICVISGACLLVGAIVMLISWQWGISYYAKQAQTYVKTIKNIIPTPQNAALEEKGNNTMPTLAVDGTDFVGIIEIPRYNSTLPVGANWGQTTKYPCCFSGSIYNGSLKIGATTQKGQYDFYTSLSVGDTVKFTDMQGNCYNFVVTNLKYTNNANKTTLNRTDAPLTLFIKNVYSLEYLIVSCNVLS